MSKRPNKTPHESKIIIVSEFADKHTNSTGYYWSSIAGFFQQRPQKVKVISTPESCQRAKAQPSSIEYIPLRVAGKYKKNSLVSRAFGQARTSVAFIAAVAKHARKADALLSGTNPPFLMIALAILRPILRFRWILLVHDVFPENTIPAGISNGRSLFYKLSKKLFDWSYGSTDAIISIGRDMEQLLRKKVSNPSRIRYIPNFVDLSQLEEPAGYIEKENETISFVYFGNIGRVQGIDTLLEAIRRVKNEKASFTFIGDGALAPQIELFMQQQPEERIRKIDGIPFERNNEGLFLGDVAIVPLKAGMYGLGVPSKAYFAMAAGRRLLVIGDNQCELSVMLEENPEAGWFCEAGDPEKIAEKIDAICASYGERNNSELRKIIESKYSATQISTEYNKLLDEILG